jgi:protein O-GlcNAc transferase
MDRKMPAEPHDANNEDLERAAIEAFQGGNYADAVNLARRHIARTPGAVSAHTIIGMAEAKRGQFEAATKAFRKYTDLRPKDASGWANLGGVLRATGRANDAVKCFRKVVAIAPDSVAGWNGLGASLRASEAPADAVAAFRKALALAPKDPGILANLGEALLETDDLAEAETALRQAFKMAPRHRFAATNLGIVFSRRGRYREAVEQFGRAVKLTPNRASPLYNLGVALHHMGQMNRALDALKKARKIEPAFPGIALTQARILKDLGHADAAIAAFTEALREDPKDAEAHFDLGNLLFDAKGYSAALEYLEKRVPSDPTGGVTFAAIALRAKKPDAARQILRTHRLPSDGKMASVVWNVAAHCADFRKQKQLAGLLALLKHSPPEDLGDILGLTSVRGLVADDSDIAQYLALQKSWSDALRSRAADAPLEAVATAPAPANGKLRIAFMTLAGIRGLDRALLPLVERLDRARFEVVWIVAGGTEHDREYWSRFGDVADRFVQVPGPNHRSLAHTLAGLGIDILIDLNGIQQPGSLIGSLAWRPAKLQLTWAGSPTECRFEALDYQIVDTWLVTPEGSPFAEREGCQPLLMPEAWMCVGSLPPTPMDAEPPSASKGTCTFGNMLTPDKLTADIIGAWADILKQTPASRLILSRPEYAVQLVRDNVRDAFENEGVADRIEFRWTLEKGQSHLDVYREIDVALDAYPVGGGVTVAEALWMGVPCVTWVGPLIQHRVGQSVLAAVAAEDLAANTRADYVACASALAKDEAGRRAFRDGIRERMAGSALFNQDIYVPQFADTMWDLARKHGLTP